MFSSLDLLPTLASVASVELSNNPIDGKNVWCLITEKETDSPQDYYAFSTGKNFESIMSGDGRWKLHLPHAYNSLKIPGNNGDFGQYDSKLMELSLFDMKNDPYESTNVIDQNPEIKQLLLSFANTHKEKFFN